MKKLIEILSTNKAKTFYWTTLYGFIGIIITGMSKIDWVYTPMIIAGLNGISKHLLVTKKIKWKK